MEKLLFEFGIFLIQMAVVLTIISAASGLVNWLSTPIVIEYEAHQCEIISESETQQIIECDLK